MERRRARSVKDFPQTRWSLVGRAGRRDSLALATLISLYIPVLRSYLCYSRRFDRATADEILQSFTEQHLLNSGLLSKAVPERGRFRSLLIVSLNNHITDLWRKERQQRGNAGCLLDIDAPDAQAVKAPADADVFDLLWARQVVRRALDRARNDCILAGQENFWTLFEVRVLHPALDGSRPAPYAECIEKLSFPSVAVACNALITVQRRLRAALRATIADYTPAEEIEDELNSLRRVFSEHGHALEVALAPAREPWK
jgi:DNA-directed RNA polymerase specialized sigma24 family protein